MALSRKILVIIYNMLKNDSDYDENSFELARVKQEKIRVKKFIAEARRLGLEVINPPQTA